MPIDHHAIGLVKILLIEDNPADARLLERVLREERGFSFALEPAGRLSLGLKRLREERFDVVLLDLFLPDSGGFDTFARVAAEAQDIPVIVIATFEDEALGRRVVREGAQDYLVKSETGGRALSRAILFGIERKKAEAGLKRAAGVLKRAEEAAGLSKRIVKAQEEERRWVARELHDSVNQLLSSVKYRMQTVEGKISGRNPALSSDIGAAKSLLEKSIQEIRRISQNLRPTALDDLGLIPAVAGLCDQFKEATGIELDMRYSGLSKKFGADIEITLYRILQEALNNVVKHSGASRVTVRLYHELPSVTLTVRDNGKGFDPELVQGRKTGLGLLHIRERAEFIGGTVRVNSVPGKGTEIVVKIPTERRAAERHEE